MTASSSVILFFFFNDTATTEIYTLSLHDALPIFGADRPCHHPAALAHLPQHGEQAIVYRSVVRLHVKRCEVRLEAHDVTVIGQVERTHNIARLPVYHLESFHVMSPSLSSGTPAR